MGCQKTLFSHPPGPTPSSSLGTPHGTIHDSYTGPRTAPIKPDFRTPPFQRPYFSPSLPSHVIPRHGADACARLPRPRPWPNGAPRPLWRRVRPSPRASPLNPPICNPSFIESRWSMAHGPNFSAGRGSLSGGSSGSHDHQGLLARSWLGLIWSCFPLQAVLTSL